MRSDWRVEAAAHYDQAFQSTLLREERRSSTRNSDSNSSFQSTLLREERPIAHGWALREIEFQSTLLREERPDI